MVYYDIGRVVSGEYIPLKKKQRLAAEVHVLYPAIFCRYLKGSEFLVNNALVVSHCTMTDHGTQSIHNNT